MAAGTRLMLEGPIALTLLQLAWPNVLVMLLQSSVSLIEAYFVGRLGTEALAGLILAFPPLMLMQMMSAGAIGGGVTSAIARALGSGRRADADELVFHALIIALVLGGMFTTVMIVFGPALYRALGASGATYSAALAYSNVIFAGAILLWMSNILSSVVRGTGNMAVPAGVLCFGAVGTIILAPGLIFGWGPLPRLGVAGGAVALLVFSGLGNLVLLWYLLSGRGLVRLRLRQIILRWSLFADILKVGAVAAMVTLQTNLTVLLITGMVGTFGAAAIAGYGIGSRLEYLLVPLVFGMGAPMVAMVGTNIGAGHMRRALQIAWTGAAIALLLTGTIGGFAAVFPEHWIGLFSEEPDVIAAGSLYFGRVAPFYGCFGLGMALYFASQGASRMVWPFVAGLARLVVATAGGWIAFRVFDGGLGGVFAMLAAGLVVFGAVNALAVMTGSWLESSKVRAAILASPYLGD